MRLKTSPLSPVILQGDALDELKELETGAADFCLTSPPVWGWIQAAPWTLEAITKEIERKRAQGFMGFERNPEDYAKRLRNVFNELRRVCDWGHIVQYEGTDEGTWPDPLLQSIIRQFTQRSYTVIDPFHGSGRTQKAAEATGRGYIGIELNADRL